VREGWKLEKVRMSQCTLGVAVREVELGAGGTDRERCNKKKLYARPRLLA
jgi:hypothetical protein